MLLVLGPDEGSATDVGAFGSLKSIKALSFVLIDESLVGEIIDSNALFSTNDEPIKLGGEEDDVDWGFSINFFKMSSFNQVPDVHLSVSAT